MAELSTTSEPQVLLLCRSNTKVDSDDVVEERSTASKW